MTALRRQKTDCLTQRREGARKEKETTDFFVAALRLCVSSPLRKKKRMALTTRAVQYTLVYIIFGNSRAYLGRYLRAPGRCSSHATDLWKPLSRQRLILATKPYANLVERKFKRANMIAPQHGAQVTRMGVLSPKTRFASKPSGDDKTLPASSVADKSFWLRWGRL
jgi:hypothetical protein